MKLWKLARLLEQIPDRLPFTQQLHRSGPAVQQFSQRDLLIYSTGLLLWFGYGVVAVFLHTIAAGSMYLVLGPSAYILYLYLACARCPYYGRRCYMGGGQCAPHIFKARQGDYTLLEDILVPLLWIGISIYPPLVLMVFRDWIAIAIFSTLAISWQIFHKRNICSKCLNVRCALNPHFVGRTGRH